MSVLHLLGTAGEGGAETYFIDLVLALAGDGMAQAAALRPHPLREARLRQAGVGVETFGFGGPLDLMTRRRIGRFAKDQKVSLALAWMNRAARHTPKGPWARIGRLGGYYSLKYYAGFDVLVANTQDIADWVAGQGWPADKLAYIPNFAEAPAEAAPVDRSSLETPPEAPLLLAMGRLHEAKAHDVTLNALTRLPEAYLWIAGTGPEGARLKSLAVALGVAARVRFLGWRNDPSALYRAADVCVFPSRFEPLGNVVIQAWAHGLPVAAAASQGPGALIRADEDGLLVPVDDPEALATAVRRLLDDPMLRIRLAQNGLSRVEADFSQAAIVAQWRTLFARYGAL